MYPRTGYERPPLFDTIAYYHCYEVTFVKRKIKEYSPLASHSCRSLTASGKSHDLPVPGIWPLCYSWIGYQQANGSPRALQSKNVGHYFYCAYIVETQIARTLQTQSDDSIVYKYNLLPDQSVPRFGA